VKEITSFSKKALSSSFLRETLLQKVLLIYCFLNGLFSHFTLQIEVHFFGWGKNLISSNFENGPLKYVAPQEAKKPLLSEVLGVVEVSGFLLSVYTGSTFSPNTGYPDVSRCSSQTILFF
jgi:hypothetical protein